MTITSLEIMTTVLNAKLFSRFARCVLGVDTHLLGKLSRGP